MPAPKKYHNSTPCFFNAERDILTEFKEVCSIERKSFQQKLNEVMTEIVVEYGIGKGNPLNITYGLPVQRKITSFNAENPIETLDLFLENKTIGHKQWDPAFAKIEDQEQLTKYVNLSHVINASATDRLNLLKTGKAVVRAGKVQHTVPQMKGTRSGF